MTSERCLRAVELLRDRYGMADASPFSYVDGLSPHLNLPDRAAAVARRGGARARSSRRRSSARCRPAASSRAAPGGRVPRRRAEGLRVVGHGAVVVLAGARADALETVAQSARGDRSVADRRWAARTCAPERVAAMRRAGRDGRARTPTPGRAGRRRRVRHRRRASTRPTRRSTAGVPMLSYPFHGDQPGWPSFCERHGLALPLVDEPRAPLTPEARRRRDRAIARAARAVRRGARARARLGARRDRRSATR